MPFIVAAIGSIATAVSTGFAALGTFGGILAKAAIGVGLNLGLNSIFKKKAPKQGPVGSELELQTDPARPRSVPIGTVATAGRFSYFNSYGSKNQYLQMVYDLCDWQTVELTGVYVNGERYAVHEVSIPSGNTEHKRYEVGDFGSLLIVRFFNGTMTQAADKELVDNANPTGRWDATCKFTGMTYVSVTLTANENRFPGANPPEFVWELKGAVLYDWRKDSTNGGAGAHRWNDVTTWEWSENPVVAEYNFRRGFFRDTQRVCGMAMPVTRLLHAHYTTAANVCEETVTDNGENVDRYRVSMIVKDDQDKKSVIEAMQLAHVGKPYQSRGLTGVIAGAAQASVATITEDDLIVGAGPIRFRKYRPRTDLFNVLQGNFTDPATSWQPQAYPTVTNASWRNEDNGDYLDHSRDLLMVTSKYQCSRIALIIANRNRLQRNGNLILGSDYLHLDAGDWITYTRKGDTREYEIVSRKVTPDGTVSLEIEETDSDVYSPDPIIQNLPVPVAPAAPSWTTAMSNFGVIATTITGANGQKRPALSLSWTPPDDVTVVSVAVEYRVKGTTNVQKLIDSTPEDGGFVIQQDIMASTIYEARVIPIVDPPRVTTWTAWTEATATNEAIYAAATAAAGALRDEIDALDGYATEIASGFKDLHKIQNTEIRVDLANRYEQTRDLLEGFFQDVEARKKLVEQRLSVAGTVNDIIALRNDVTVIEEKYVTIDDIFQAGASVTVLQVLDIEGFDALAARVTTVEADVITNAASVVSEASARATADSALAQDITDLETSVDGSIATINNSLTTLSDATGALSSSTQILLAARQSGDDFDQVQAFEISGALLQDVINARIAAERTAADVDTVATLLGDSLAVVTTRVDALTDDVQSLVIEQRSITAIFGQSFASISSLNEAIATEQSARATAITTLQTQIEGDITTVEDAVTALQEGEFSGIQSIDLLVAAKEQGEQFDQRRMHHISENILTDFLGRARDREAGVAARLDLQDFANSNFALQQDQIDVVTTDVLSLARDQSALSAAFGNNFAQIYSLQEALADETEARVTAVDSLTASIGADFTAVENSISLLQQADLSQVQTNGIIVATLEDEAADRVRSAYDVSSEILGRFIADRDGKAGQTALRDTDATTFAGNIAAVVERVDAIVTTQQALVQQSTAWQVYFGDNAANILQNTIAIADEASARAAQYSQLGVRLDNFDGGGATLEAQFQSLTEVVGDASGGLVKDVTDLEASITSVSGNVAVNAGAISSLQVGVDQRNRIFAQDDEPTATNIGDLWIETDNNNKPRRWSGSTWADVQSSNMTVFRQSNQPTTTVVGALWIDTDNDNRVYRWSGSAWQDFTDPRISANASAITAINSTLGTLSSSVSANSAAVSSLQTEVSSKSTTYYQSGEPSDPSEGDIWIKTTEANAPYRRAANNTWVKVTPGTMTVFVQPNEPATVVTGALWIDTDDSNKIYRWNNSAWVLVADTRIAANASAITSIQSQINNPTTGLSALATAVGTLVTNVATLDGQVSANATAITQVDTKVDGNFANASIKLQAASNPTGTEARVLLAMKGGTATDYKQGGFLMDLYETAPGSGVFKIRATFDVDEFYIANPAGNVVKQPLSYSAGTGKFLFGTDVAIDGNLVVDGTITGSALVIGGVDSEQIAANAATQVVAAKTNSTIGINVLRNQFRTDTVQTLVMDPEGASVILMADMNYSGTNNYIDLFQMRIKRGTTILREVSYFDLLDPNGALSCMTVDTAGLSGDQTYSIETFINCSNDQGAQVPMVLGQRVLTATRFKR